MPDKSPHLLTELKVRENSLVTQGANPGADIILLKSECDKMETKDRTSFIRKFAKYLNIGKEEGGQLIIDVEGEPLDKDLEKLQKSLDAQAASILVLTAKNLFGELMAVARDSIAKASDDGGVDAVLTKIRLAVDGIKKDHEIDDASVFKAFTDTIDGDLADRAKARKEQLDMEKNKVSMAEFRSKLSASMQKRFDDMDEKDRLDFMKGFKKSNEGDSVTKAMDELTKSNLELQSQVTKLEAESEITKALKEFKDLEDHLNVDDFAKTIIKIRKHDTGAADSMITQTRAMAAQAKAGGLFLVKGKIGEGNTDADGAIDKAAAVFIKADPNMSKAEAITKALEADPSLYKDYNAEQEAG